MTMGRLRTKQRFLERVHLLVSINKTQQRREGGRLSIKHKQNRRHHILKLSLNRAQRSSNGAKTTDHHYYNLDLHPKGYII